MLCFLRRVIQLVISRVAINSFCLIDVPLYLFILFFQFPPFCVNETGRVGGFNRREVGHGEDSVECVGGAATYIFQRYDTYIDTRATIRYTIRYITVRDKTSHLDCFQIGHFHKNKFNIVTTQHQIALQGLKCRAWARNTKDSDFTN